MSTSSLPLEKKQHWWLSNRKAVDKYIRDSRTLIATREPANVSAALGLLDAALAISPRADAALELKARSLLFLGRFREVADTLQDYIPSYKTPRDDDNNGDDSTKSSGPSATLFVTDSEIHSFRCFSVSDLKRNLMDGLSKNREKEGCWRYLILGKACYHLGLMEDAMILLQTGRRLATEASRRESMSQSDDVFANTTNPSSDSESASLLLSHIKLLLRRRAAALAVFDSGVPSESVRHFSKILESRRGIPHAFAASCFVGRASAYRTAGQLVESIADCNRALAVDPTLIPALRVRADLFESVRALPYCLRDLDHLKLLYNLILRERKLTRPAWRPHYGVRYRDIPARITTLGARIRECRRRVASGEGYDVDYYALFAVRRGCARSELDRAHLLLTLRHKPDKAAAFADRLEFADEHRDLDSVRDQARMSALILFRMLHKGYASILSSVKEEEAEAAVAVAALKPAAPVPVYQRVFCRDIAAVGSVLSRAGKHSLYPYPDVSDTGYASDTSGIHNYEYPNF